MTGPTHLHGNDPSGSGASDRERCAVLGGMLLLCALAILCMGHAWLQEQPEATEGQPAQEE